MPATLQWSLQMNSLNARQKILAAEISSVSRFLLFSAEFLASAHFASCPPAVALLTSRAQQTLGTGNVACDRQVAANEL